MRVMLSNLCQHGVENEVEKAEITHDLSAEAFDVGSHLAGWCVLLLWVGEMESLVVVKRERKKGRKTEGGSSKKQMN